MPAVLEGAVPPPHLHLTTKASWPSYNPHKYPVAPTSSPTPMSPESLHSYMPHLHESPLPSQQDLAGLPTSGWFGPSVSAPDCPSEVRQPFNPSTGASTLTATQTGGYAPFGYDQPYVTPHTSTIPYSPPTQFPKATEASASLPANVEPSVATFSPVSQYSKVSDAGHPEPPYADPKTSTDAPSTNHLQIDSNAPNRPHSSPSTFSPNQTSSGPVEYSWTMNPLGISTPAMHGQYYSSSTYPSPRRMYAPIAPHPIGPQRTSVPKRPRDDDEGSEHSKRRKRSDSNMNMAMELSDEDKLLIKLKDEESMPWKDIAARFQSDLGKTYQIPALQMRLKRLRERMRVWTETDLRALRMAHEYWVQSKFDIISQKMLEYGAAEKWTARQCARKWAEIDPGPKPDTTYDHHTTASYAPYTMSPVEAPPFMPYLHIP